MPAPKKTLEERFGEYLIKVDDLPAEFISWIPKKVQDAAIKFTRDQLPADVIAKLANRGKYAGVVSVPPLSPANGDEFDYVADAAAGVVWRFRYNAASDSIYKWEFVGGAALIDSIPNDEAFTDDGAVHDAATPGPLVTLPFAGDYELLAHASLYIAVQSATARNITGVLTATSGTYDANGYFLQAYVLGSLAATGSGIDAIRGVVPGTTVTMQYLCAADSGTAQCRWRQLAVRPIRVS